MNTNIRKKATLMLLLLSLTFAGHSQTISSIQRIYCTIDSSYASTNPLCLKSLAYSKDTKMALCEEYTQSSFIPKLLLFTPNKLAPVEMRFDTTYKIYDFDILGDTVYFAGQDGDSNCFLAYFNIKSMINAGNTAVDIPVKYTLIGNSANRQFIYKIKAFKNAAGERIVVGIGNFYYRDLVYRKPIFDPSGPSWELIVPTEHYHNYVMFYTVTEENYTDDGTGDLSVLGTTGNKANNIRFYRNPFNADSIKLSDTELFADIAITDNYICILSQTHESTNTFWWANSSFGNRLILRTFDKNTLQQKLVRYITINDLISTHNNLKFIAGKASLHLAPMYKDRIAVSYAYANISAHDTVKFVVDKINLTDSAYQTESSVISSHVFNSFELIRDLTYNSLSNQVLLLLEDSTDNKVYSLPLKENTPANSTCKYFILDSWEESVFGTPLLWNSMHMDSYFYLTVLGTYRDNGTMYLINKNIQNNTWKCLQFKTDIINEWKDKTKPWLTMPNLVLCNFATGYSTGNAELGRPYRKTRISSFIVKAKRGKSMSIKCN